MSNPFEGTNVEVDLGLNETDKRIQQKLEKRNSIYEKFDPMVGEVLDLFIDAHKKGIWERGSDMLRQYSCHISWFAGEREKFYDPYDKHHTIRRRIEITLEMDGLCNPTGFAVAHYGAVDKKVICTLDKEDLISGLKQVVS